MLDILLRNGDLVASKYGDIVSCMDEDEDVIQTANNNILLRYGNNKFHLELGNKIYGRRVKSNQGGIEVVQAECISAILNDSRIKEITQVNVTLLENATCMVDYILVYTRTNDGILAQVDGRTHINAFNY